MNQAAKNPGTDSTKAASSPAAAGHVFPDACRAGSWSITRLYKFGAVTVSSSALPRGRVEDHAAPVQCRASRAENSRARSRLWLFIRMRQAALALNVPEQAQDLPPGDGVQGRHRLVRQQDGGVPHQGAGDGHPLLLPAGEVFDRLGAACPPDPTSRQERGGLLGPLPRPEQPPAGRRAGSPCPAEQALSTLWMADWPAPPGRNPGRRCRSAAGAPAFSGRGPASKCWDLAYSTWPEAALLGSVQDAEQGGFPGAGRADDREELAVAQGEADLPPAPRTDRRD